MIDEEKTVRVVFLYAIITGYVMGMLKALSKCAGKVEIDVVHWDKKYTAKILGNCNSKSTVKVEPNTRHTLSHAAGGSAYNITQNEEIRFHDRYMMGSEKLFELLNFMKPDIVYVSGWMDKGYLNAIGRYRASGGITRVVCGLDDQWWGTLRQHLGRLYFRIFYSKIFDFMWVSGKPQYKFAQNLGYSHERIITNMYSADTEIFHTKGQFLKRFVYVGRFGPLKALDLLVAAYLELPGNVQREWPLVLIGDGECKESIQRNKSNNIKVMPSMQPVALQKELMKGGVGCMASHTEQWGVSIQEMALLGYPLILSSACGAATEFLISGYNGFLFRKGTKSTLRDALLQMADLSDRELASFSSRSHSLGKRITSEHAAFSLLSAIPLSRI